MVFIHCGMLFLYSYTLKHNYCELKIINYCELKIINKVPCVPMHAAIG